jgi:WD40 repeat protein
MLVVLIFALGREISSAAPLADAPKAPATRFDRYGDPLPEGALVRLGTYRYRAPGIILHAALSPDGKQLAVGSPSGTEFFDLATGKSRLLPDSTVPEFFDTNGSLLAYSPDGKQLINVTRGGNLHFWDVTAGKRLRIVGNNHEPARGQDVFTVLAPLAQVTHFSKVWFPPQGKEVVAGTPDNSVHFIEPSSGEILRRFRVAGQFSSIAADGKSLVAINDKRPEVILYDDRGNELRRFRDESKIDPATLCQEGKRLVTFNDKSELKIWDTATGKLLRTIAVSNLKGNVGMTFVTVIALAPDGNTLFAGTREGPILRWDVRTGTEQSPLRGHNHFVTGLFPKADGKSLVSASWDKVVRRWRLPSGETEVGSEGFTGPILVARSPDGRTLATTSFPGRLELWDSSSGKRLETHSLAADSIFRLSFAPDGKLLALASSDLRVRPWDLNRGQFVRELKPPSIEKPRNLGLEDMVWTPEGKNLAVSYWGKGGGTWVWEAVTGKEIWHSPQTGALAFSPDGRTLVRCGLDDSLTFQEAGTGKIRFVLKETGKPDFVKFDWGVAFSSNGSVLATNHLYGNVRLRDPSTGKIRKFLPIGHHFPRTISFSPDGKWLASGALDKVINIWEVASTKMMFSLKGHREHLLHLEFGPNGRTILTASNDLTALLWDLHPGPTRGRKRPLETLWTDLAGEPANAYRAIWELADDPKASSDFLRQEIAPVAIDASERRVRALLDDLDDDSFAKRESASRELAAMGAAVEGRLRRTLADTDSSEVRRRLGSLLDELKREHTPEDLRRMRAVQVMELCNTADTLRVLRDWAGGTAGAPLTEEAKAALQRSVKSTQ